MIKEKVPKQVKYVDYENRQKVVKYTVPCKQTRYKNEKQCYTVKVPKTGTKIVNVKKKVPKTIFVDVCVKETRPCVRMTTETRDKTVWIHKQKTIWLNKTKTTVTPVTKMVTRELP